MIQITTILLRIEEEKDKLFVEDIYIRFSKKMYLIAFNILHNRQDAEDCVHDTIVRIVNHLERFKKADSEHLKSLILICCRNIALDKYKRNKREKTIALTHADQADPETQGEEYDIPDESTNPEKIIVCEESATYIHTLVDKLDEKYRDVIEMRYYLGLSINEISCILGTSEAYVRVMISRAKQKLLKNGGETLYGMGKNG